MLINNESEKWKIQFLLFFCNRKWLLLSNAYALANNIFKKVKERTKKTEKKRRNSFFHSARHYFIHSFIPTGVSEWINTHLQ